MDPNVYFNGTLIMVILGMIVMAINVIIFMIGYLIKNESVIGKAKIGMLDVLLTMVLFILLFTVISLIDDNIDALVLGVDPYASAAHTPLYNLTQPPYNLSAKDIGVAWDDVTDPDNPRCIYEKQNKSIGYPSHICVTLAYLESSSKIMEDTMLYLLRISALYSVIGNFQAKVVFITGDVLSGSVDYVSVQPFKGLGSGPRGVDQALVTSHFNRLTKMYSITKFQEFFFDLFYQVGFSLFLTLGFIFRMFNYTRKLGGFIIATVLALYYAAPFGYIIMHRALYETNAFLAIYNMSDGTYQMLPKMNMLGKETLDQHAEYPPITTPVLLPIENFINQGRNLKQTGLNSIHLVWDYIKSMVKISNNPLVGDEGILQGIARMTVLAVVVPTVVLFIVLSSIKAIAPLFGGESTIAGLTNFL